MKYGLDTFRGDPLGGIASTVVALPVALGFGIASGMGAASRAPPPGPSTRCTA